MFFFYFVEMKSKKISNDQELIWSDPTCVRLNTNNQEFLTLLHLRSFKKFQNLSEETWSRVAENLTELCFVAFLNDKSKKCFILVWIIFPFSEIIAISILHCVVWTFWQKNAQISMNWNLMLNFVKLKQRIIKRHSSSYWPNVGVRDIEQFLNFVLLASAWDPKSRFDQWD